MDLDLVERRFRSTFSDKSQKVVVMADIPYSDRLPALASSLTEQGYTQLHVAQVRRDTLSLLPNRTVPEEVVHVHALAQMNMSWGPSPRVKRLSVVYVTSRAAFRRMDLRFQASPNYSADVLVSTR